MQVILARRVRGKLAAFRQDAQKRAYQHCLFEPEATVDKSFDNGFEIKVEMYWGQHCRSEALPASALNAEGESLSFTVITGVPRSV